MTTKTFGKVCEALTEKIENLEFLVKFKEQKIQELEAKIEKLIKKYESAQAKKVDKGE